MIGIYKITNPKKRVYIGQTVDIERRFNEYKKLACKNQKSIYNSLLKYGVESHQFEVLTECFESELNDFERYFQELYNVINNKSGLNCKLVGTTSKSGMHSKDVKLKIGRGNKGKVRTLETRNKISKSRKGKCSGKDHPQYGKKFDSEWRRKLSEAKSNGKHHLQGKKLPKEWVENIHKNRVKKIGFDNHRSKIVLNTETGIYYGSCSEASFSCNMKRNTLLNYLNGCRKNKTSFIQA